jgi:hypothetical protein
VLVSASANEFAVSGNDINSDNAHARWPEFAAVPAEATLKQETAEANSRAVTNREEEIKFVEFSD